MKSRLILPKIDYLQECFKANFDYGLLVWNVRPLSHFKTEKGWRCFNTQNSGKEVGTLSEQGYYKVALNRKNYLIHRILWKMYYGLEPPLIIDHIDENKQNNKIENLQNSDRRFNKVRSSKVSNSSGFRGGS